MDGDRRRQQQEGNNGNNAASWAAGAAGIAAAAALVGGGLWYLRRNKEESTRESSPSSSSYSDSDSPTSNSDPAPSENGSTCLSYLTGLLNRVNMEDNYNGYIPESKGLNQIPDTAVITNLNSLLADIHVRYIAFGRNDFRLHYSIFDKVFHHLHQTMKKVDPYYQRYSSTVSFAGSHYDNLRIKKPDEFDMDIVIGLPLNISDNPYNPSDSDIKFEPQGAGFVELKMGVQYKNLPMRDGNDWLINKTAYKWKDDDDYLTRSKFIDWFKSVVVKALNQYQRSSRGHAVHSVDGLPYTIRLTESGPAITLIIENSISGFKMDVDLVPALRFPEARWPIDGEYREIAPHCKRDYWLVVPKPNKETSREGMQRSWRIALHYQERELMHDSYNLRQTIRFLKKLRDSQGMNKIASYYIKTLVLWEVVRQSDSLFWRKSPGELFVIMVDRLHTAVVQGKIPYFWNPNNNLLAGVRRTVLDVYAAILKNLLDVLAEPSNYKRVAKFLLTPDEFDEYNRKFLHI
ncbi:cyclic GMP-AMP synthase-like [Ostrinia furnacalis]|uniref:cyclic GMP-AMP synthase-like n=1 Tax=Ostrinia furnacalis TaxID=93504 RepID=UPI00103C847A|nr:cyclic GMP-AMP synthase-like [Ostrinia furnacalis]